MMTDLCSSLRGIRDGLQRRLGRAKTGLNQDDLLHDSAQPSDIALEILKDLERVLQEKHVTNLFKLPFGHDANHEDLRKPLLGLPSDCIVKPKNRFLALKPQIALRSEIDDNAIVLLAVEEVSFKEYAVLDELALDDVTADVLNR